MRSTKTLLVYAILASAALFGCSKRAITSTQIENYKRHSQQLEMDYPANNSTLSASASEEEAIVPNADTRFESAIVPAEAAAPEAMAKSEAKNSRMALKSEKKMAFMNKLITKKVEKMLEKKRIADEKAGVSESQVTGRLRTGIILAAIGLLLLITAGFFGAASPIVYVVGAVFFIIGIIFILLDII